MHIARGAKIDKFHLRLTTADMIIHGPLRRHGGPPTERVSGLGSVFLAQKQRCLFRQRQNALDRGVKFRR